MATKREEANMLTQYYEVLSKSRLFFNINGQDLPNLINCIKSKVCNYRRGDFAAIAGDEFTGIGIVLKGQASVIKENAAGKRIMMTMLEPGDMFGEMIAFSGFSIWPVTVQSHKDSTIIFLAKEKILGNCERICPWHRTLIYNMLRVISERALMLNKKVEYLTTKSMRGKISSYLLDQYKNAGKTSFILPMKRNELADFLNVSRPSMSREMSRMREDGIIDFCFSSIKILDIEALKNSLD